MSRLRLRLAAGAGAVALLAALLAAGSPAHGIDTYIGRVDALAIDLGTDTIDTDATNVFTGIPADLWSDGTTMWLVDDRAEMLRAYRIDVNADGTAGPNHGDQVPGEDFTTLSAAGNSHPKGIWSDGTTMWVADNANNKVYAYDMVTKERVPGKDIEEATLQAAGASWPQDIWSDGETMWVADFAGDKAFALDMNTQAHLPDKDLSFDTSQHPHNCFLPPLSPAVSNIWSDGTTMWALITQGSQVQSPAFWVHDGRCDTYRDLTFAIDGFERNVSGMWADETFMWYATSSDAGPGQLSFGVRAVRLPPSAEERLAELMVPKWDMEVSAEAVSLKFSWDRDSSRHDEAEGYLIYLGDPADYGDRLTRVAQIEKADTTLSSEGDTVSYTLANDGTDEGNVLWPDTDYLVLLEAYYDPWDQAGVPVPTAFDPNLGYTSVRTDSSEMVRIATAATTPGAAISNLRCTGAADNALESCQDVARASFELQWDGPAAPPVPVDHYEVTSYDTSGDAEHTSTTNQARFTISAFDNATYDSTTNTWVIQPNTYHYGIRAILKNRAPGATSQITITTTPPGGL